MQNTELADKLGTVALGLFDRLDVSFGCVEGSRPAALLTLLARKKLPVGLLGEAVGLSQSATVRLVDRLGAEGLIARNVKTGRVVNVTLTLKGKQKAERLAQAREAALMAVIEQLEPVEREALNWLSGRLLDVLSADSNAFRPLHRWSLSR